MKRRHFHVLAAALASSAMSPALSQSKTLRLVVPFPAGGATDLTARLIAEPLGRLLGQTVVVDNRSGAGGSLGMADLAKAAPDGATLGLATLSTHGVNPAVYKKLPYDPVKDFAPVMELVKAPGVLLVHPSVQASTLGELVALLKSSPGRITYASPGNGTIGHLWAELFKSSTGTFMLHIPYRGAAPALNDLLGGQVQVYFDQVASSLSHVQSGKLRALAVSWPTRLASLPNVPTFAEAGLPTNNEPSWFGLLAPAGTPAAVVARLQEAVATVLKDASLARRLEAQGLFPSASTSTAFGAQIQSDIEKMKRVGQFAKISVD